MSYRITELGGSVEEREQVCRFLADFVKSGQLLNPRPGDDNPRMWERRMGWWWDDNPHCDEDSPRGYILEHETCGIVGFSGFIPSRYEVDGEEIPSLLATTLFVDQGHRAAVIGLIARQRKLGTSYQVVDGSPSPEVRTILDKIGYRHVTGRMQALFTTGRIGGRLGRSALRGMKWSFPLPRAHELDGYRIITDLSQWQEPPFPKDGRVRRSSDRATMEWLIRSGSESRQFFGLLSPDGRPIARAMGVYVKQRGILACRLLDYRDCSVPVDEFFGWERGLGLLVRKLLLAPEEAELEKETKLLVISHYFPEGKIPSFGRPAISILRYSLPHPWQDREKVILPVEGDIVLL